MDANHGSKHFFSALYLSWSNKFSITLLEKDHVFYIKVKILVWFRVTYVRKFQFVLMLYRNILHAPIDNLDCVP